MAQILHSGKTERRLLDGDVAGDVTQDAKRPSEGNGRMPQLDRAQCETLKEAVKASRWTQSELAERIGYSRGSLSNILAARKTIRTEALEKLVSLLALSPGDFLDQYTLFLDDELIEGLKVEIDEHLERLQREVGRLSGFEFYAFVGFRARGTVEQEYEGRIPLRRLSSRARKSRAMDSFGTSEADRE